MDRWTPGEITTALDVIRRGGTIEDLAAALPERTERALAIKARRLQDTVLANEDKARATVEQQRKEVLTPEEIVSEFKRLRAGRTDVVTEQVLADIALTLGVTVDRLRETMLRHWGVLSD